MRGKTSLVIWALVLVVVLLGAGLLIGFPIWMRGVLRSAEFQQFVAAQTGQALGAQATYSPISWEGASAFADSLQVEGGPATVVKELQADQVRAKMDWQAVWDGVWRIDRIDVVHFEGTFGPREESAAAPAPAAKPSLNLPSFLPRKFELGALHLAQAGLTFRADAEGVPLRLQDSRLVLKPSGAGWTLNGQGGSLSLPHLPEMEVVDFRARLQEGVLFLTESNLRLGENGTLTANGEFGGKSQLQAKWKHLDVATFLDETWRTRLSGRFDGTIDARWPEAGPDHGAASGTFLLTEGLLQEVPLLNRVADFTGARQFRHMPVQEFSGHYQWTEGTLTLTDLVLESQGLMRIEGRCQRAADGTLTGTLRVGVTPQTLQWLPGSRERVFTKTEKGYLWTPLRLSGTWEKPKEDLSPRLMAAMKDEVIDQGRKALDVLPGPAKKGAQDVFDALAPLLK